MKKTDIAQSPDLNLPAVPVICDKCRAEGSAGDEAFAGVADILNFTPVPRRTHVNSWTAEHQRAFIAALAITGSAKKAAATIGRHVFGADQLRKSRGGRSFAEAWDAALELAQEREVARVRENLKILQRSEEEANAPALPGGPRGLPAPGIPRGWGDEGEEMALDEVQDVQAKIRGKLLGARRMALKCIADDPEMRAAWEVLVGPVDWDRAREMEPQANEPFEQVNMHNRDMILTAESGWLNDSIGLVPNMSKAFWELIEDFKRRDAAGLTKG